MVKKTDRKMERTRRHIEVKVLNMQTKLLGEKKEKLVNRKE